MSSPGGESTSKAEQYLRPRHLGNQMEEPVFTRLDLGAVLHSSGMSIAYARRRPMKDHIHPPVGIDVSKKTLDVQLGTTPKNKRLRHRFANEEAGFADLLSWMQEQGYGDAHVCLEATGTYSD